MRAISPKRRKSLARWHKTTVERVEELDGICEFCGQWGRIDDEFNPLVGHHKTRKSQGGDDTKANCFIAHWLCHGKIHADRATEDAIRENRFSIGGYI